MAGSIRLISGGHLRADAQSCPACRSARAPAVGCRYGCKRPQRALPRALTSRRWIACCGPGAPARALRRLSTLPQCRGRRARQAATVAHDQISVGSAQRTPHTEPSLCRTLESPSHRRVAGERLCRGGCCDRPDRHGLDEHVRWLFWRLCPQPNHPWSGEQIAGCVGLPDSGAAVRSKLRRTAALLDVRLPPVRGGRPRGARAAHRGPPRH